MHFNKKHVWGILILFCSLIFWLIPINFNITFSSIDDCFYMWITSGIYTGSISAMTAIVGYPYSVLISGLYGLYNGIEWYSWAFYVQMYICYLSFLWMISRSNQPVVSKIALLLAVTVVQAYFEFQPHNGIVCIEDSIAAMLLLFFYRKTVALFLAFILFFFATQMRFEAAFIPFMVGFPVFFYGLSKRNWRKFRLPVMKLVGVFLIGCCALLINKMAYSAPEWKTYSQSNYIRGYLVDNPSNEKPYSLIKTPKDQAMYDLTAKIRMADPATMDYTAMNGYVKYLKDYGVNTAVSLIHWYYGEYKFLGCWWAALLGIVCIFVLCRRRDTKGMLVFLSSLVMFGLGNFYMMSQSRPKGRLLIPFIFVFSFVCLWLMYKNSIKRFTLILIAACLLFSATYLRLVIDSRSQTDELLTKQAKMEAFLSDVKDSKLVTCISPYPEIFHASESIYGHKSYFPDWEMCTPLSPIGKGVEPLVNGIPMLCDANNAKNYTDVIARYIHYFYGLNLAPHIEKQNREFKLIRFVKQ